VTPQIDKEQALSEGTENSIKFTLAAERTQAFAVPPAVRPARNPTSAFPAVFLKRS
jgi:hypothetical protein